MRRAVRPAARLALIFAVLAACAPVRNEADEADDDVVDGTHLETLWRSLESGTCAVVPEGDVLLATGAATGTTGLWYDVACVWTGGNASSVTVVVDYFDERAGGDFEASDVRAVDAGGRLVTMEGDLGSLHVLPGETWTLNGWWEGDLVGTDAAGGTALLEAVVFKDSAVESVVGR